MDSESEDIPVHTALENELILCSIFEKLANSAKDSNVKDLLACRLVCYQWSILASKFVQKYYWKYRKILQLESDSKLEQFLQIFGGCPEPENSAPGPALVLHTCVSLKGQFDRKLKQEFFQTFGGKFKSLSLDYDGHEDDAAGGGQGFNGSELQKILESQAASLTELRIRIPRGTRWRQEAETDSSPKNTRLSGCYLPQLAYVCLDIQSLGDDGGDDVDLILRSVARTLYGAITRGQPLRLCVKESRCHLAVINELGKFDLLKYLTNLSTSFFRYGELQILSNFGVKLQFFECAHTSWNEETGGMIAEQVCQYLKSAQGSSIFALSLEQRLLKSPIFMNNLRQLKLIYKDANEPQNLQLQDQFEPIFYSKYFPNLEVLVLSGEFDWRSYDLFFAPQPPCTKLKHLDCRIYDLTVEAIQEISNIFPALKTLALRKRAYSNSSRRQWRSQEFFTQLWNASFSETLEELTIHLIGCKSSNALEPLSLDVIFSTALLNQAVSTACRGHGGPCIISQHEEPLDFDQRPPEQQQPNSILRFKNLKKLCIRTVPRFADTDWRKPFTDISAYSIFGKMKSLEKLYLDSKLYQFSSQAIDYLRSSKAERNRNSILNGARVRLLPSSSAPSAPARYSGDQRPTSTTTPNNFEKFCGTEFDDGRAGGGGTDEPLSFLNNLLAEVGSS